MTIAREEITGLVLGSDHGLKNHLGMPLALHVLMRLSAQVGEVLINANRNIAAYEAMGAPVWPDPVQDVGPLGGLLAGLERCETPYVVSVPCDTPVFPDDLVERLAQALDRGQAGLAIATAGTPGGNPRLPAFCLMKAGLAESLGAYLHRGGRDVAAWVAQQQAVQVPFDDAPAFLG
jgi:molybdenum cofactor guanylyltransferase